MSERGYFAIGLFNPKTVANIGGVLRAAGCYGASMVAIQGLRYTKASTDTLKQWRHAPLIHTTDLHDIVPYACEPIAVDLVDGAKSLVDFHHPERAFYIFGPEDGTLGKSILDRCPRKLMVPTRYCMNLAACVNVVLYDRMAKQKKAA